MKKNKFIIRLAKTGLNEVTVAEFISSLNGAKDCLGKIAIVPNKILNIAFETLNCQFEKAVQNTGHEALFDAIRNVYVMEARANAISTASDILERRDDCRLVELLRSFGYSYEFDRNHQKQFAKDLGQVANEAQQLREDLVILRKKFNIENQKCMSESFFSIMLNILHNISGNEIDPTKLLLSDYISLVRQYKNGIANEIKNISTL